jgi:pseudouridine synthase
MPRRAEHDPGQRHNAGEDRVAEAPLWEQWEAARAASPAGERLQKVLAAVGWGSRRACEELIAAGRVTVNGEVAELGRRVDLLHDVIAVDGAPVGVRPGLVYYLLNKPAGVVTTAKDTHGRPTVVDLVPSEPRVFPVGRLDADSEGLLLLTDDGRLQAQIAEPKHKLEKTYWAQVEGVPEDAALERLRAGIPLADFTAQPARVRLIDEPADLWPRDPPIRYRAAIPTSWLEIRISEGKNRQVRRMTAAIGYPTLRLVRAAIGTLSVAGLGLGEWRRIDGDIRTLRGT